MTKRFSWRRILGVIFLMLVTYAFVCMIAWHEGRGGIEEFSPQTLETRSRTELLMPLTGLPIYRGPWTYTRGKLEDYLIKKGHWKPDTGTDVTWVHTSRWNMQWRDGHSRFHIYIVIQWSNLITWSEESPELAALYWPTVLERLRSPDGWGSSEDLDDLMAAKGASTIKEYQENKKMFRH